MRPLAIRRFLVCLVSLLQLPQIVTDNLPPEEAEGQVAAQDRGA